MRRRQQFADNQIDKVTRAGTLQSLLAICAVAIALAVFLVPSWAWAQDASLTLRMKYASAGKTTPVAGITATLYQVASLDDDLNSYTTSSSFDALSVDFNQGMSASAMADAAKRAAQIASDAKLSGTTATSGADGLVRFGTLPNGVYLVLQTGSIGDATKYNNFAPFLISVPQISGSGIIYNVESLPKFTAKPQTKEPVKPLTKTGDDTNPSQWVMCTLVGVSMVLAGHALRRRQQRSGS